VLQHLPGIAGRNMYKVMRNFSTLQTLANATEAQLAAVLDAKPARELYNFLHKDSRR